MPVMPLSDEEFYELQGLVSTAGKTRRALDEKLSLEKDNLVSLLVLGAEKENNVLVELVRALATDRDGGILVSGRIPTRSIERELNEAKVETSNIFFVDFATRRVSPSETANSFFVGGPKDLTGLNLALEKTLAKFSEKERFFLVFDCFSVLKTYHSPRITERFVHMTTNNLRKRKNLNAVAVEIEAQADKAFLDRIESFFDKSAFLG